MTADAVPDTAPAAFRCSAASRTSGEPLVGSASTARGLLVVEVPGPWGVDAVRDSRLPDEVKAWLRPLQTTYGVRPLLMRRPGRPAMGPCRVFHARVRPRPAALTTATFENPRQLCDLDPAALADGTLPGFAPHPDPVFLVCTHGRHDACCAERGRPLAASLAQAAPDQTWEVSHVGGDRFAANVVVLPQGLYYGRLEPEHAAGLVAAHQDGLLDLEHLRGRASYSFPVQAAEIHLRGYLDETRDDALRLVERSRTGEVTTAVFAVAGDRWRVRVERVDGDRRQLTCRASGPSLGPEHRLVEVTRA